jgi:RHS repeat-associated protein
MKRTGFLIWVAALTASMATGTALAELPSMKFMTAPLVSPSTTYYGSATTHTVALSGFTRAPEIKELANGLGKSRLGSDAYASRVYQYIYANVRTSFMFGLQKGALGALIDQAGTPFDQANLMVELLREGGIAASYQLGVISLNGTQAANWFGTSNAAAVCQILADGGIPGSVNGSSDCSVSGTVSSVTMLHIWVSALSKNYDPSFKVLATKTGIDLASAVLCGAAAGCTGSISTIASTATSVATGSADQSAAAGAVNAIRNVNQGGLESQLATWAMNLKARLDAQYPSADLTDVIGSQTIDPASMPSPGAALPYGSPTASASWSEIPDQYRTTFRVQYDNINVTEFADEIWGRPVKLYLSAFFISSLTAYERAISLHVGAADIADSSRDDAAPANDILLLSANHPYAANNGTYMDDTVQIHEGIVPVYPQGTTDPDNQPQEAGNWETTLVIGWGDVGQGSVTRTSALQNKEVLGVDVGTAGDCGVMGWANKGANPTFGTFSPGCTHPERSVRADQWLAETARMGQLVGQINSSLVLHHHSLGAIIWDDSIDVESDVSTVSKNNQASDVRATNYSYAALSSRLEGGVREQLEGAWDGGSPASVMARSNQQGNQLAQFNTSAGYSGQSGFLSGTGTGSTIVNYLNAGYSMLVSPSAGYQFSAQKYLASSNATFNTAAVSLQIPALGVHPSAADATIPDRIAFLMSYTFNDGGMFKGADSSIPTDTPAQSTMQTTQLQDVSIKARKYFNADRNSGGMKITPPPDLKVGAGEFPYSLAFQRYYDSKTNTMPGSIGSRIVQDTLPFNCSQPFANCYQYPYLQYAPDISAIGGGWEHNWNITATVSSDPFQAMGEDSPIDAVAAITTIYTLRALTQSGPSFQNLMTAIYSANWFGSNLVDNAVVVHRPPSNAVFIRLPDGSFNGPSGSPEVLTQSGSRAGPFGKQLDYNFPSIPILWDYHSIRFTLTEKSGAQLLFDIAQSDAHPGDTLGFKTFKASQWSFPAGVVLTFAYDTSKQPYCLSSVTSNLGHSLTFIPESPSLTWPQGTYQTTYYGQCYIDHVVDDTNRSVLFTRPNASDAIGQTGGGAYFGGLYRMPELDVQTPDGATTRYLYTDNVTQSNVARVGSVITSIYTPGVPSSPFLTAGYDSLFRVNSLTDAVGNTTRYFIGEVGYEVNHLGESQDALGAVITSYFDKFGNELQTTDAIGRVTSKIYDGRQRLKKVIYPENNSTEYAYDARSNQIQIIRHPKSGTGDISESTSYPTSCSASGVTAATCNLPLSHTDALGRVTSYGWNAVGQIASIQKPAVPIDSSGTLYNPQTSFCYGTYSVGGSSLSLLTATVARVDGTRNRVSSFSYDSSNFYALKTATTDPTSAVDLNCNPVSASAGLNLVTTYSFDSIGNVHTIDGPRTDVSDVTTYTFDSMRRLKEVDGPSGTGIQTIYGYDADGLLRTTQRQEIVNGSSVMRTESRDYYNTGDLKTVTDPKGNVTQYAYDAAGRQTLVTDPDNRRTGTVYDAAGEVLCVWRGWNSTTAPTDCAWDPSTYAGSGRVRYSAFQYTPNGKQWKIWDADNNATTLAYDTQDRLSTTTFPDGTYELLWYTTDGTPTGTLASAKEQPYRKLLRNGQTILYTYDAVDRMVTKSPYGLPPVAYFYDLLDEPFSLSNSALGSYAAHSTRYDYDGAGRKRYENNDGLQVSYGYDAAGNRATTTWPDSYTVSYQYDVANRMSAVWEGAVGATKLADYGYDSLSRRTSLTYAANGANTIGYGYEPNNNLNLLTNVLSATTVTLGYGRNNSGQITGITASDDFYLAKPAAASATGYAVNNLNEYTNVGSNSTFYDTNGNLTSWVAADGRQTFTYDSENRLRTAAVGGSSTPSIFYDYDPLGRRVSKTVNGTVTRYLLDGDEEIAEYDGSGNLQRRYITGPAIDDRIALVDASGTRMFYHVNHQGSVIAMTDGSGAISGGQQFAYDAYGNLTSQQPASPTGQPFRFTGRRFDIETGLYYYRARYYSPILGRFLQPDPIGYKDDIDLYAYVHNDPIDSSDPSGTECAGDNSCARTAVRDRDKVAKTVAEHAETVSKDATNVSGAAAATAIASDVVTSRAAIGKGATSLAVSVGAVEAAEKVGKIGDAATVVKAGAELVAGNGKEAAKTTFAAAFEKLLGAITTAVFRSPAAGAGVEALAARFNVGDKAFDASAGVLEHAARRAAESEAANAPTGPFFIGPPIDRSLCGLAGC